MKRKASSTDVARPFKQPRSKEAGDYYGTVARTRGIYGIKGEMKYFDSEKAIGQVTTSDSWTGCMIDPSAVPVANINCLFAPTQGAGINQRIGKACHVLKIKIKGFVLCPAQTNQGTGDAASIIRIILAQDMQTNSTQMTGTQLMTTAVSSDTRVAVQQFQNINNFGRFKVLKEKMISLANATITYDGTNIEQSGLSIPFKMTVNFPKGVQVRFNATNGGTIADIIDNSFHLVANATTQDMAPYICYACRVSYKE